MPLFASRCVSFSFRWFHGTFNLFHWHYCTPLPPQSHSACSGSADPCVPVFARVLLFSLPVSFTESAFIRPSLWRTGQMGEQRLSRHAPLTLKTRKLRRVRVAGPGVAAPLSARAKESFRAPSPGRPGGRAAQVAGLEAQVQALSARAAAAARP